MSINLLFAIYALASLAIALCLRSYAVYSTRDNRRMYNDDPPLTWCLCVIGSLLLAFAAGFFAVLALFWGA